MRNPAQIVEVLKSEGISSELTIQNGNPNYAVRVYFVYDRRVMIGLRERFPFVKLIQVV